MIVVARYFISFVIYFVVGRVSSVGITSSCFLLTQTGCFVYFVRNKDELCVTKERKQWPVISLNILHDFLVRIMVIC